MKLEFLHTGTVTDMTDVEGEVLALELEEQGDELLAVEYEKTAAFEDTNTLLNLT